MNIKLMMILNEQLLFSSWKYWRFIKPPLYFYINGDYATIMGFIGCYIILGV